MTCKYIHFYNVVLVFFFKPGNCTKKNSILLNYDFSYIKHPLPKSGVRNNPVDLSYYSFFIGGCIA